MYNGETIGGSGALSAVSACGKVSPSTFDRSVVIEHYAALCATLPESTFSGYPKNYQRVDQKSMPVIEALGNFSGRRVLEIGSNFGMYSLLMSGVAAHVTALEPDEKIFHGATQWREFFEKKGYNFANVRYVNQGVTCLADVDYDALLMTLVLYHLNNDEIDKLVEDARSKCQVAIVQCRPGRAIARERGSFGGYLSKNDRFDGLCDIAGNVRFLRALGMRNVAVTVSAEMLGDEVFPVLVGRR